VNRFQAGVCSLVLVLTLPGAAVAQQPAVHGVPGDLAWRNAPLSWHVQHGELTIRDSISPEAVRVRLNSSTKFFQGNRAVSANVLTSGSLVAIKFSSEGNGREIAREISILALPGTRYTFAGQIVHIDLRTGLLVINSSTDHKTYEVYLDPSVTPDDNLHPGAVVTVVANFENSRYVARNLTIDSQGR